MSSEAMDKLILQIQKYIKIKNDVCDEFYKIIDERRNDSIVKQYDLKQLKQVQEDIETNFNKFIELINQANNEEIVSNFKDLILKNLFEIHNSMNYVFSELYVIKNVRCKEVDKPEWFEIESSNSISDLRRSNTEFTRAIQRFKNDIHEMFSLI